MFLFVLVLPLASIKKSNNDRIASSVLANQDDEYSDEDYDNDDSSDLPSPSNSTLVFVRKLMNETKESDEKILMKCEVQNLDPNVTLSKIKINWRLNHAPFVIEGDKRITIKRNEVPESQMVKSRLRIVQLSTHDSGYYSCIATSGKNKIKSAAFLKVYREQWSGTSSDLPKYEPVFPETPSASNVDFTTLLPNEDRKEGDIIPTFAENGITIEGQQSQMVFTKNSDLDYGNDNREIPPLPVMEPFCQLYNGTRCKQFLQDKYVFIQPPFTQKTIEDKLENSFLVISHSNDLSANCEVFAQPSLCYSAFPICLDESRTNMYEQHIFTQRLTDLYNKLASQGDKIALQAAMTEMYGVARSQAGLRRICREDCEILENELCRVEYAIAKRHPVIGQTLSLEECVNLPDKNNKNSDYCLPLGIDRSQIVQEDDSCYWGLGESYRGIVDVSANGTPCVKWAFQLQISLSDHPELAGGHAYCRNPGSLDTAPFCFTNSNKKEICNVQKCSTLLLIYLAGTSILLGFIGIGISIYFCCIRKRKMNPRSLQNMNVPTADKNIYGNSRMNSPMELNPMLPPQSNNMPPPLRNHNTNKNAFQNVPNYSYKEVSFVEELGEGAFGKVYKGELKTKSGKIWVAVKALKENASAKTQADFQREIELISELRHPNIICLLGIIVKQEPMCMLFEFMSEGDLHEFLRANSPSEGKSLTQSEFLHIALQIALGMEYLSGNHYVHRDLAARNCLVSKDLIVKISDFGLSRDMYSCDYYRVQSKSLLPVRWMPPESILYGKFTTESDVWSFGVVLWEIYSYGLQPYYGYNNQEVINMIRSRRLLPCPDHCPSHCYSLMVECWAELAVRRPSFGEICHRLRIWKHNGATMTGVYFKNHDQKNPQRFGHSSKSQTFNQDETEPSLTWDRKTLNESQSSLTSRTSSLGGKTQSTNVSDQNSSSRNSKPHRSNNSYEKKHRKKEDKDDTIRKNTVVSATNNGDNFETALSH